MSITESPNIKDLPSELTADERIDEFIRLTAEKRRMQDELKPIEERLDVLGKLISGDFLDNGKQADTRRGFTVYLARDISVKSKSGDTGDVVDKLRRARLGELIGINWPKIKAWCRERMYDAATDTWEVNADRLPPSVREVVDISEFYAVRCRKA